MWKKSCAILSILRLMKSIERVTGGIFGNKNYFEMFRGQFTNAGRITGMF
jgi:hypothetical protein